MIVDENLIRAVERMIDGGVGHHYYGTIHRYRKAADANNQDEFKKNEDALRNWVLWRTKELMPDSYRTAITKMIIEAANGPVPCESCHKAKVHGKQCSGNGKEPCWALRNACEDSDGKCCKCKESS